MATVNDSAELAASIELQDQKSDLLESEPATETKADHNLQIPSADASTVTNNNNNNNSAETPRRLRVLRVRRIKSLVDSYGHINDGELGNASENVE